MFVRETLGCGCPDKVFEKIDVSRRQPAGQEKGMDRMVVGDRLLIYIVHPERDDDLIAGIRAIGTAGRADRDANGYNRFRLVVSGVGDGVQQAVAAGRFAEMFGSDERMHIHFVDHGLVDELDH